MGKKSYIGTNPHIFKTLYGSLRFSKEFAQVEARANWSDLPESGPKIALGQIQIFPRQPVDIFRVMVKLAFWPVLGKHRNVSHVPHVKTPAPRYG